MVLFNWLHEFVTKQAEDTTQFAKEQVEVNIIDSKAVGDQVRAASLELFETESGALVTLAWSPSDYKIFSQEYASVQDAQNAYNELKALLLDINKLILENKTEEAASASDALVNKAKELSKQPLEQSTEQPLTQTQASKKTYQVSILWPEIEKNAKATIQNIFFSGPNALEELLQYQRAQQANQPKPEEGEEGKLPVGPEMGSDMGGMPPLAGPAKTGPAKPSALEQMIDKQVAEKVESSLEMKARATFDDSHAEAVKVLRKLGRSWEEIKDFFNRYLKYDWEDIDVYLDQFIKAEQGLLNPKDPGTEKVKEELANIPAEAPTELNEGPEVMKGPGLTKKSELVRFPDALNEGDKVMLVRSLITKDNQLMSPGVEGRVAYVAADAIVIDSAFGRFAITKHDAHKLDKTASLKTEAGHVDGPTDIYNIPMKAEDADPAASTEWMKLPYPKQELKKKDKSYVWHDEPEVEKVSTPLNEDVINLFVEDSFPKDKRPEWGTANLRIKKTGPGWALINYATPLMYRDSNAKVYFNTQRYSQTTSRIQNMIRNMAAGYTEVDESGIMSAIQADGGSPKESTLHQTASRNVMYWDNYELEYYEEGGHNLWTLTLKNTETDENIWHTDNLEEIQQLFEDGWLNWKKPEQSIKYILDNFVTFQKQSAAYSSPSDIDDNELLQWVMNDEGLYNWMRDDIRRKHHLDIEDEADPDYANVEEYQDMWIFDHKDELQELVFKAINKSPAKKTWRDYSMPKKAAETPVEPLSDVWQLETSDEEMASVDLSEIATRALEGDTMWQEYLMVLWEESWESIKKKLETEGSVWYVWWMDGVRAHMQQQAKEEHEARLSKQAGLKTTLKKLRKQLNQQDGEDVEGINALISAIEGVEKQLEKKEKEKEERRKKRQEAGEAPDPADEPTPEEPDEDAPTEVKADQTPNITIEVGDITDSEVAIKPREMPEGLKDPSKEKPAKDEKSLEKKNPEAGLSKSAEGFAFSHPGTYTENSTEISAVKKIWEESDPESRKRLLSQVGLNSDLYVNSWDVLDEKYRKSLEKHMQFKGAAWVEPYKQEKEDLLTELKPFDRVRHRATGEKGTVLTINDMKPGDVDVAILWDKPHEGYSVYETDIGEIERTHEPISEDLKSQAEHALKQFKKDREDYEEKFEDKIKNSK